MASEMIQTVRNENIFVNVKRRGDPLRENIGYVVIGVCPVMEFSAECALPFLCGNFVARIGCMENETLKLQLTDGRNRGPDFEGQISIRFV